jgi:hypothetical protein
VAPAFLPGAEQAGPERVESVPVEAARVLSERLPPAAGRATASAEPVHREQPPVAEMAPLEAEPALGEQPLAVRPDIAARLAAVRERQREVAAAWVPQVVPTDLAPLR